MQLLQILNDFKKSHRILVFYKIFGLLLAFSTNPILKISDLEISLGTNVLEIVFKKFVNS